ncbi:hypothetical protein J2S46_005553 [Kitasatospora herbaricolor]|nr:hypothetical protein [Kitasatospora herbaricolor]
MIHLVPHDSRPANDPPDRTLVQNDNQQRPTIDQEPVLSAQSRRHPLLDEVGVPGGRTSGKERPRVVLRLQQTRYQLDLVLAQGDRLRLHLCEALEPVRVFDLGVPVDPIPDSDQDAAHEQHLVALLDELLLRDPAAVLDPGDERPVAVQEFGQSGLGVAGRLTGVTELAAEQYGRTDGRTRVGPGTWHSQPL